MTPVNLRDMFAYFVALVALTSTMLNVAFTLAPKTMTNLFMEVFAA